MTDTFDVGITASRRGLTTAQNRAVRQGLADLLDACSSPPTLRHGMCVGGDAQVHRIARELGYRIVGHPPVDTRWKAEVECDEVLPPLPFICRNEVIVERCTTMWCLPGEWYERSRGSGTWATIRHAALRMVREGVIVFPDGTYVGLDDWAHLREA